MTRPRILLLSQMYPSSVQPTLGTFMEQRARALAEVAEVRIAAPTPYFPPLPWLGRYSKLARLERQSLTPEGRQPSFVRGTSCCPRWPPGCRD